MLVIIKQKFSVIVVTETWIISSDHSDCDFPGQNFMSNHLSDRTGGGDGMFINEPKP